MTRDEWLQEYHAFYEKVEKAEENAENGIEMPVEVFCEFLSKWPEFHLPQYAWCASGKEMHDRVRLSYKYGTLGVSTPREGYYKIVGCEAIKNVHNKIVLAFQAYYNYREPVFAEFESQKIIILGSPLYNKASSQLGVRKGIAIGDVIHVTKRTELVETIFEGETSKSYSVTWEIL